MIRIFAILLLCSISCIGWSQNNFSPNKKVKGVFPVDFVYKNSGWFVGPGLTYTLTRSSNPQETIAGGVDTAYLATFDPNGKIGAYLEFGRYHSLTYWGPFKYLDYSIAGKWLRGNETFVGEMFNTADQTSLQAAAGEGNFSDIFVLVNFNLNNVIPITDRSFVQNSIGVNGDYRLVKSTSYDGGFSGLTQSEPSNIIGQLHYKLGYGIQPRNKDFVIIPSIETPILNAYKFEDGKSTLGYFNSRYRPLIFSVRILFLRRKNGLDCKPPKVNPSDKEKQDMFDKL